MTLYLTSVSNKKNLKPSKPDLWTKRSPMEYHWSVYWCSKLQILELMKNVCNKGPAEESFEVKCHKDLINNKFFQLHHKESLPHRIKYSILHCYFSSVLEVQFPFWHTPPPPPLSKQKSPTTLFQPIFKMSYLPLPFIKKRGGTMY